MTRPTETEVKIRLSDSAGIRNRLDAAGFVESVPRQFESNTLYDTSDHSLGRGEMLLRLRQAGEQGIITWKGPGHPGPHKSRPELETTVGSLDMLGRILGKIGFQPSFRYEKYRTEFSPRDKEGVVTLDETPIGDFLELEGPAAWIDQTAHRLGFSQGDYVLESYGRLYLAHCERRGVEPADMVFASH